MTTTSKKMRAVAVAPTQRQVKLVDHPIPQITAPNQLRVRTIDVGICGTDREICTFVYGHPPKNEEYLILGHESLGVVEETGSAVSRFKAGDLVVPTVRRPCTDASCVPCSFQRQDFCFTWKFTERGINQRHGYMTEYFVEEQDFLILVPPALRDVAVLVEPLTVAEKGLAQMWKTQERLPWLHPDSNWAEPGRGRNAVVIGAGPIGTLGAMALQVRGFNTVVYSRSPKPNPKADLLESIGVKYYSAETTSPQQLADLLGNIDLVYEGVGEPQVSFDVLKVLGINGVFIFTGIPAPDKLISIDGGAIMRNIVLKNQAILGTVNADRSAFENAIKDLALFNERWPAALRKVITGRFSIESYQDLLQGKASGIKNVIQFAK